MLRRLEKLGIHKTDPNELTPEEITQFARLDIDQSPLLGEELLIVMIDF